MQKYLTPEEIAQHYQVTQHTVRLWCRTGKLNAIRVGKQWKITPADLEAFIQQQTEEAKKGPKKEAGLAA